MSRSRRLRRSAPLAAARGRVLGNSNRHSPPTCLAEAGRAERQGPSCARVRRWTIGRRRPRASSTSPSNTDLAFGDDRDPLAQPLGVGDDMGRKDDGDARRRLIADQLLKLLLVDRVEPGKGLVEHDQARLVDDRAEQLDGLSHALADRVRIGCFAQSSWPRDFSSSMARRRPSLIGRPRSAPMKAIASTAGMAG